MTGEIDWRRELLNRENSILIGNHEDDHHFTDSTPSDEFPVPTDEQTKNLTREANICFLRQGQPHFISVSEFCVQAGSDRQNPCRQGWTELRGAAANVAPQQSGVSDQEAAVSRHSSDSCTAASLGSADRCCLSETGPGTMVQADADVIIDSGRLRAHSAEQTLRPSRSSTLPVARCYPAASGSDALSAGPEHC